ncbi:HAD family hydrolase [Desulfopila sp. IMCC35008]|uniref:HAD family hydrolase n=1 Tax=Desulfopila sp. IMCC35008 TaxID=2653858 RepID=UPI0013D3A560|nr:HAD family hydrolase [Desulfopila sp. IMCC35008]
MDTGNTNMGFEKYYSLSSLIAEGKRREQNLETVSFDLFDTLVIRRVHDPDLVKLPVARFIAAMAKREGIHIEWEHVQDLRDSIEAAERKETGKSFDDHEACYPNYMTELLRQVFQKEDVEELLSQVTAYELFMENQMLVPRGELVDWLKELHKQGKRVFIVSDIYLPSDHLRILVENAGFLDYVEDVISSADTFLAKASGRAFPLLMEKYSLFKSKWLHIGDNPISDGLRPAEFGIDALVLSDPSEKRRKGITKRYLNYSLGRPFWRGRALQQLMQPHECENVEQPALYREGYSFLGPLVGGFVQYLAEQCIDRGITKIFFLAREGYTFKKYWEKCMPALYPDGGLPEIEYLYVSRMALAGASCAYKGLLQSSADIAFLPPGNKDFRDLCRIFKFDSEPFADHLTRFGLAADTALSPVHDGYSPENSKSFLRLLKDTAFQEEVKRQARTANDALMKYLENVGFFDHSQVAVVDIGWLGTIQRFLYDAVSHRDDSPRFFGYLFGATRGIPYPESPENIVEGVIYDKNRFNMASSSILYARDLFEEACRAPHPTLNGYKLTDEGYELEFRHVDDTIGKAEKEQDEYFAPLQQGMLDAAPRYGAASALLGYRLHDYRPWFNYMMLAKLAFPRTSEIKAIRHKHHLDDFHGQHNPNVKRGGARLSLWEYSLFKLRFSPFLRLRLFLRHLRNRIKD